MIQEKHVQTLMGLGLTSLQAKTYLTLAKLGKAEVRTISKASNAARQDIYRIIPTLQKMGLAEKIIATPTIYKATPLEKGLSTLLQQKIEENDELQEKTNALINSFEENTAEIAFKEDRLQFIITSEESLFRKRITEATNVAQTSNDVILTSEGLRAMLFHQRQNLKRAMKKGVKIRVIAEKPENKQLINRTTKALEENSFFKLKYISVPPQICMAIFDNKEVNIRISNGVVPSFWSNNPNIVNLAISYFDKLWNKAD